MPVRSEVAEPSTSGTTRNDTFACPPAPGESPDRNYQCQHTTSEELPRDAQLIDSHATDRLGPELPETRSFTRGGRLRLRRPVQQRSRFRRPTDAIQVSRQLLST
jgi:hypothetical protein